MNTSRTQIFSVFGQIEEAAANFLLGKYPDEVVKIPKEHFPPRADCPEVWIDSSGQEAVFAIRIPRTRLREYFETVANLRTNNAMERTMPTCYRASPPRGFNPDNREALSFYVAPRYTPGTRGPCSGQTAKHFSEIESQAYDRMINGVYGETKKAQAKQLGLSGIVEERWEFRGRRHFRDLITKETGVLDSSGQREVIYGILS